MQAAIAAGAGAGAGAGLVIGPLVDDDEEYKQDELRAIEESKRTAQEDADAARARGLSDLDGIPADLQVFFDKPDPVLGIPCIELNPKWLVPKIKDGEEAKSELYCYICHSLCTVMMTTTCGHALCRNCLPLDDAKKPETCAICRQPTVVDGIPVWFPDTSASKALASMIFLCQYKGCSGAVPFGKDKMERVKKHLLQCDFRPVPCAMCRKSFAPEDIFAHGETCMTTKKCDRCNQDIDQAKFADHRTGPFGTDFLAGEPGSQYIKFLDSASVAMTQLPCKGFRFCNTSMCLGADKLGFAVIRGGDAEHKKHQTKCDDTVVSCPISVRGCKWSGRVGDLYHHLTTASNNTLVHAQFFAAHMGGIKFERSRHETKGGNGSWTVQDAGDWNAMIRVYRIMQLASILPETKLERKQAPVESKEQSAAAGSGSGSGGGGGSGSGSGGGVSDGTRIYARTIRDDRHRHDLTLTENPYDKLSWSCDGCHLLGATTSYHCAECKFDLHPECSGRSHGQVVHHQDHSHPLKWTPYPYGKGRYGCDGCSMQGTGPSYQCDICKYDLHPDCVAPRVMTWFELTDLLKRSPKIIDGSDRGAGAGSGSGTGSGSGSGRKRKASDEDRDGESASKKRKTDV